MTWKCPECGADVPNDTGRCQCGYDERAAAYERKKTLPAKKGRPWKFSDLLTRRNIRLFGGLAFLVLLAFLPWEHMIGYSYEQTGDKVLVQAGSAPWALLFGAAAGIIFLIMMKKSNPAASSEPAGLLRRLGAFFIDFMLLVIAVGGILGLLLVFIEYKRTGIFLWYFRRDFALPNESVWSLVLSCPFFASMILYYAYPPARGKQTIGCYFMSIMVESSDGSALALKTSLKRVVFGLFSLGFAWITAPCATKDSQRRMWHDKKTHSRVVFVQDRGGAIL